MSPEERDKAAALKFIKKALKRHGSSKRAGDARFRRMETPQKFTPVHTSLNNHFIQERHLGSRQKYKARRSAALAE